MSSVLSLPRVMTMVPGLVARLRRLLGYRARLIVIGVLLVCCAASVVAATQSPTTSTAYTPVPVHTATAPALAPHPALPRVPARAAVLPTPAQAAVAAPVASPAPRAGSIVLHRGDTLWGLARRYGTTVAALQHLNNLGHSTLIRAGATLQVPARATSAYRPAASTSRPWDTTPPAGTVHPRPSNAQKYPVTLPGKVTTHSPATNATPAIPPIRAGTDPVHQATAAVFGPQYQCAANIITRESGWNVHATNRSSGAYGLAQALPATKMVTAGPEWRDDPTTQLLWMRSYVNTRYSGACAAWTFWQRHSWY
jgi:LysM repeat protein